MSSGFQPRVLGSHSFVNMKIKYFDCIFEILCSTIQSTIDNHALTYWITALVRVQVTTIY